MNKILDWLRRLFQAVHNWFSPPPPVPERVPVRFINMWLGQKTRVHATANIEDLPEIGWLRDGDKAQTGEGYIKGGILYYSIQFGELYGWVRWNEEKMFITQEWVLVG